MMQILKASNITIYEDNKRQPDENNPLGYFEVDKIGKKIKDNPDFFKEEKCIKLVSLYLKDLIPIENVLYNIIFMERKFYEIFESMEKMSKNSLTPKKKRELILHVNDIKEKMKEREDVNLICIYYNNLIKNPEEELNKLKNLIPEINYKDIIRKDLYHNKHA